MAQNPFYICNKDHLIPLKSDSVDIIFSNLTLHDHLDFEPIFKELKRVLKPQGALFFTTFGPNTLIELQKTVTSDLFPFTPFYKDMHDLGDLLLKYFENPVMDMEMITLTYSDLKSLLLDLKITQNYEGAHLADLAGYEKFKQNDLYPASFEILYGHAWKKHTIPLKQVVAVACDL